jgi:hypothetical protein
MSSNELICPFTTDLEKLLKSMENIKIGHRINLENSFNFAHEYIINEWGCFTQIEVIFFKPSKP